MLSLLPEDQWAFTQTNLQSRLSSRLLGRHTSDRELLVWHTIKIAGAIAIWYYVPQHLSPWILFGLAAPTLFIAGRNVVRARKA